MHHRKSTCSGAFCQLIENELLLLSWCQCGLAGLLVWSPCVCSCVVQHAGSWSAAETGASVSGAMRRVGPFVATFSLAFSLAFRLTLSFGWSSARPVTLSLAFTFFVALVIIPRQYIAVTIILKLTTTTRVDGVRSKSENVSYNFIFSPVELDTNTVFSLFSFFSFFFFLFNICRRWFIGWQVECYMAKNTKRFYGILLIQTAGLMVHSG